MNITDSPTFCPCPWTALRLGTNGGVGICSFSRDIGNSNDSSISDIVNSDKLKSIQQAIRNGEWHENCFYCEKVESTAGGRSQRLHNIEWMDSKDGLKDFINDNSDKFNLVDCSINWSNLCNLACNYCTPEISTGWQTALGKTVKISSMGDNSIDWLANNSDNLISMMIGGGEPLLQKNVDDLLSRLSFTRKNINIHVTTNLSVDLETNPMFNRIKDNPNFEVVWSISFDCLGDKFEYVRHGAEWAQFTKNIATLKKYEEFIIAHPAYGLYTAFDLEEYIDFCVNENINIWWCEIFEPHELDTRLLPESLSRVAIQNIDNALEKYKNISDLDLSLGTLVRYKEMIKKSMHMQDLGDLTDSEKAKKILAFNEKIEKQLPKKKSFAELWPNINNSLIEESRK
jgi:MoaA/NifB/PqqE/SkfB family radical SAM enzyme